MNFFFYHKFQPKVEYPKLFASSVCHFENQEDQIVSYLKNSFFSSSVFNVRLLRKFITSRKSFLFKEKQCLKANHFRYLPATTTVNMTTQTWKSHESAGSSVVVETKGQSSAGPPAESFSGCQPAPGTLETVKDRECEETRPYTSQPQHWKMYLVLMDVLVCILRQDLIRFKIEIMSTHHSHWGEGWVSPPSFQKSNSPESELVCPEAF